MPIFVSQYPTIIVSVICISTIIPMELHVHACTWKVLTLISFSIVKTLCSYKTALEAVVANDPRAKIKSRYHPGHAFMFSMKDIIPANLVTPLSITMK